MWLITCVWLRLFCISCDVIKSFRWRAYQCLRVEHCVLFDFIYVVSYDDDVLYLRNSAVVNIALVFLLRILMRLWTSIKRLLKVQWDLVSPKLWENLSLFENLSVRSYCRILRFKCSSSEHLTCIVDADCGVFHQLLDSWLCSDHLWILSGLCCSAKFRVLNKIAL